MNNHPLFVLTNISLLLAICTSCSIPISANTAIETVPTSLTLPTTASPIAAPTAANSPIPVNRNPEPSKTLEASPTASPTPAAQHGMLNLVRKFGYGTGLRLSPYGLQLSVDEKRLIVTSSAGIFVFSAEDLSPLFSIYEATVFPGYPLYRHVRISRDGNLAASISRNASFHKTIKFWEMNNGSLLSEYPLLFEPGSDNLLIYDFAISPDNTQVAAVSEHGFIQVINISDGKIIKTLDQFINNTQTPLWLEFDPTGKNAYYTFQDVAAGVQSYGLNSTTWKEVSYVVADITDFPWDAGAFAPLLSKPAGFKWGYFTKWGSRTISAWDYSTFGKRFDIKRSDAISAIAYSRNGQWVVMGGTKPTQLEVWDVDTVKAPQQTFGVKRPLWAVAAASSGQQFYGITDDGILAMWKSGAPTPIHQQQDFIPVASRMTFSEDGLDLRLNISNDEIYTINVQDGSLKDIHPNPEILAEMKTKIPVSITISADKSLIAVIYFSLDDHAIRLFDLATGKFIRKIPSKFWLEEIAFTPDGLALIAYSRNHPIQVLDIADGKVLKKLDLKESLGGNLSKMLISRDKSTLMLFGETGLVEIYNANTLALLQTVDTGPNTWSAAISDDGSLLAYYTLDGTLGLWDVASNKQLSLLKLDLPVNVIETTSLAISPDNHTLAFATWDGVIRIYDIAH